MCPWDWLGESGSATLLNGCGLSCNVPNYIFQLSHLFQMKRLRCEHPTMKSTNTPRGLQGTHAAHQIHMHMQTCRHAGT